MFFEIFRPFGSKCLSTEMNSKRFGREQPPITLLDNLFFTPNNGYALTSATGQQDKVKNSFPHKLSFYLDTAVKILFVMLVSYLLFLFSLSYLFLLFSYSFLGTENGWKPSSPENWGTPARPGLEIGKNRVG